MSSWNFVAECQRKRMKALSPSLPDTTAEFPRKPSWTSIKCTLLCNYGSLGMSSCCSRLTPSNGSLTLKEPNGQNEDANLTKVKLSRVRWANQDLRWREVSLTKWQNWVASTVADIKTSRLRWSEQIHLQTTCNIANRFIWSESKTWNVTSWGSSPNSASVEGTKDPGKEK